MIPFLNWDFIRRVKQDGDRWILTDHTWPIVLIGLVMVYVMIDSFFDASQHEVEDAASVGHHAANVGGDAASGGASGTLAFTFLLWPWLRRTTVDAQKGMITVMNRWAWRTFDDDIPLDDVTSITLTMSTMHAHAVFVRKNGERVRFFSAFRTFFFLGGVPRRLKLSVEELSKHFELPVHNEYAKQHGPGWMGRLFGGA